MHIAVYQLNASWTVWGNMKEMAEMKRLFTVIVMSVLLTMGAATFTSFASDAALTNVEFAELLVKTLGMNLPTGTEDLSDSEYFEVVSNLLASRGIVYFVDRDALSAIAASDLASVLYTLIGGADDISSDEMLEFLVDGGYMSPIDSGAAISLAYATYALNNRRFVDTLAEAYRDPTEEGSNRGGRQTAGLGAPAVTAEEPASLI